MALRQFQMQTASRRSSLVAATLIVVAALVSFRLGPLVVAASAATPVHQPARRQLSSGHLQSLFESEFSGAERAAGQRFAEAPQCCRGCAYEQCCCPRRKPATAKLVKTITGRPTTKLIIVTTIPKFGQVGQTRDLSGSGADSNVGHGKDPHLSSHWDASTEDLEEEVPSPARRLVERNNCPTVCPVGVKLVSPSQERTNDITFCCPPRPTVTTTKSRFVPGPTRIIRSTITAVRYITGQIYTDVNKNGKYDAGIDTPLALTPISLLAVNGAGQRARLAKRACTGSVANTTTSSDGIFGIALNSSTSDGTQLTLASGTDCTTSLANLTIGGNVTSTSNYTVSGSTSPLQVTTSSRSRTTLSTTTSRTRTRTTSSSLSRTSTTSFTTTPLSNYFKGRVWTDSDKDNIFTPQPAGQPLNYSLDYPHMSATVGLVLRGVQYKDPNPPWQCLTDKMLSDGQTNSDGTFTLGFNNFSSGTVLLVLDTFFCVPLANITLGAKGYQSTVRQVSRDDGNIFETMVDGIVVLLGETVYSKTFTRSTTSLTTTQSRTRTQTSSTSRSQTRTTSAKISSTKSKTKSTSTRSMTPYPNKIIGWMYTDNDHDGVFQDPPDEGASGKFHLVWPDDAVYPNCLNNAISTTEVADGFFELGFHAVSTGSKLVGTAANCVSVFNVTIGATGPTSNITKAHYYKTTADVVLQGESPPSTRTTRTWTTQTTNTPTTTVYKTKTTTVPTLTTTICHTPNVAIADGTSYTEVFNVTDTGNVTNLDIGLIFVHQQSLDMQFTLTVPDADSTTNMTYKVHDNNQCAGYQFFNATLATIGDAHAWTSGCALTPGSRIYPFSGLDWIKVRGQKRNGLWFVEGRDGITNSKNGTWISVCLVIYHQMF